MMRLLFCSPVQDAYFRLPPVASLNLARILGPSVISHDLGKGEEIRAPDREGLRRPASRLHDRHKNTPRNKHTHTQITHAMIAT